MDSARPADMLAGRQSAASRAIADKRNNLFSFRDRSPSLSGAGSESILSLLAESGSPHSPRSKPASHHHRDPLAYKLPSGRARPARHAPAGRAHRSGPGPRAARTSQVGAGPAHLCGRIGRRRPGPGPKRAGAATKPRRSRDRGGSGAAAQTHRRLIAIYN